MGATAELGSRVSCIHQLHEVQPCPKNVCFTDFNTCYSIEGGYHSSARNLTRPSAWLGSSSERVYNPYPDYENEEYKRNYVGTFVPCMGPRGVRLNESTDDEVYAYPGYPKGGLIGGSVLHVQ